MDAAHALWRGLMDVHRLAEHQLHLHAHHPVPCRPECRKADYGAAQKSFRRPNPYPPCRCLCFSFSDSYSHHVSGIQPCRRNQRRLLVYPADGNIPPGGP